MALRILGNGNNRTKSQLDHTRKHHTKWFFDIRHLQDITITPIIEIPSAHKRNWASDMLEISKTLFIMQKVQELSREIHTGRFILLILLSLFMG
jgi:hypothetical protein